MSDHDALEAFRRSRGLLTGDDLRAWLRGAGLTVEEWAARVGAGDADRLPGPVAGMRAPQAPDVPDPLPAGGEDVEHGWMTRRGGCAEAALRTAGRAIGSARAAQAQLPADASLADIVDAAGDLGLDAKAVKTSRARVETLPSPWIAHVDGHHWIVVHHVGPHEVVVSDPARGAGRLARDAFLQRWSGWAAVLAGPVHRD